MFLVAAALTVLAAPNYAAVSFDQPVSAGSGSVQRAIDVSITRHQGQPPLVTLKAKGAPALDVLDSLDDLIQGARILVPARSLRRLGSATVTLSVAEVTVDQAVLAVAKQLGLRIKHSGDTYTLENPELVISRKGVPGARSREALVDLQFRESPLAAVLDMIQRADPGQSYVVDAEALASAPPMTGSFNQVPLETVVRAVANRANLRVVEADRVTTLLQTSGPAARPVDLTRVPITLLVDRAPLAAVLGRIQKQAPGVSFVLDAAQGASLGYISGRFVEARLGDVLNGIARQAHVRFERSNNVFTVVPQEEPQSPASPGSAAPSKVGPVVEFKNAPLSVVLKQLSEAYGGVSFIIDDATVSAAGTVTGTFNNLDLDAILRAVATQTRTRIRKDHGVYTVTMRK
jgi:hypothetical protein